MTGIRSHKMDRSSVRGFSIVPMLTPFTNDGRLDEAAVLALLDRLTEGGSQGVLVAGTTGEASSMRDEMRLSLVATAAEHLEGRGMLFAGIGDNSLDRSIALACGSFAVGADAVVAHLPSYYPIGASEIEAWFVALADAVDGPLFLYNIPQTTRLSIPLDVLDRLSRHPRIAGLKDSEPDPDRQEAVARMFAGRDDFIFFCGAVPSTCRAMRAGADGYVPSAGNIAPDAARKLMDFLVAGDATGADTAQLRLNAISQTYQKGRAVTQSLCAMKTAASLMGLCEPAMLPPLRALDENETAVVRQAMVEAGLLS